MCSSTTPWPTRTGEPARSKPSIGTSIINVIIWSRPAIISPSLSWGTFYFPLLECLYLRQAKVKKLNRKRPKGQKLLYQSKLELAQQMLEQVKPLLPSGVPVYVLFDSWYTSAKLVQLHPPPGLARDCRDQVQPQVVRPEGLRRAPSFERTPLPTSAFGASERENPDLLGPGPYGRLRGVPDPVNVVISQKGPGHPAPRYFLCTDTHVSAQEILQRYQKRWAIETDYWQIKEQLGLGDYRLQSYEAIAKWYTVVYLVLAYLYCASTSRSEAAVGPLACRKFFRRPGGSITGTHCVRRVSR